MRYVLALLLVLTANLVALSQAYGEYKTNKFRSIYRAL